MKCLVNVEGFTTCVAEIPLDAQDWCLGCQVRKSREEVEQLRKVTHMRFDDFTDPEHAQLYSILRNKMTASYLFYWAKDSADNKHRVSEALDKAREDVQTMVNDLVWSTLNSLKAPKDTHAP